MRNLLSPFHPRVGIVSIHRWFVDIFYWLTFPISCLPSLLKISQFQQCRRLEQLETMLIQQSARIQSTNAFVPFVVSALCWNETLIQFLFLALRFRCTSLFYSPVQQQQHIIEYRHMTWGMSCQLRPSYVSPICSPFILFLLPLLRVTIDSTQMGNSPICHDNSSSYFISPPPTVTFSASGEEEGLE